MSMEIILMLASLAAGQVPERLIEGARAAQVEGDELSLPRVADASASGASDAQGEKRRDREDEQYDSGTAALDEGAWDRAASSFHAVAEMKGRRADAALYWLAYARSKQGQSAQALAVLDELRRSHSQSRWLKEARALDLEIRQQSGQPTGPDSIADEDLKLVALSGLLNTDPQQAIPLLEKYLQGRQSAKLQDYALFVLCQSGTPRAREIVLRIARGESNPELQRKAIQMLGAMRAQAELWAMYQAETSREARTTILQALAVAGAIDRLVDVARSDKDMEMRLDAIRALGPFGGPTPALLEIYKSGRDQRVRGAVLEALFAQGNAKALIELVRTEADRELKKKAVSLLATMDSKEATAFLLESLNK